MQTALHIKNKISSANKIEIDVPMGAVGDAVDVFVILAESHEKSRRSVLDILNEVKGKGMFKSPEEVDRYLREERDS